MKKFILLFTFALPLCLSAQTWSDNTAAIVYDKCAKCHHPGGIAPFSLMNYSDVIARASMIESAITSGVMPPNPPDETYQQYAHSNSLTAAQKTTMLDWLAAGAPEGNAANTPPPPVFSNSALLGDGDLKVRMPVYRSKAQAGSDDYACFSVPSGLMQDRVIKWVEIIPGNREIVHHALIYIDPNGVELTDSVGGDCSSPSNASTKLIAAYIPGSSPLVLPSVDPLKLGFSIPAGSNVYFAMHYPSGSLGQADSTEVIFHFYPAGETGIREVSTDPLLENWNFSLPANQVTNVSAMNNNVVIDYSILSVLPHMHLLGKTITAYATKTGADTVKFIHIPEWDFHWQGFYMFKNIQKVSPGYTLRAKGTFDNTSSNPNNPSSPPVLVTPGLNTNDEMFLVYFHYLPYVAGDETYDLEALTLASLTEAMADPKAQVKVMPNPFDQSTLLQIPGVTASDRVQVAVYNQLGQHIKTLPASGTPGVFVWDGSNNQGGKAEKGVYYFSILLNGAQLHQAVVKQ